MKKILGTALAVGTLSTILMFGEEANARVIIGEQTDIAVRCEVRVKCEFGTTQR